MSFIKNFTKKANELKEKTQDRIKANGGFEGILQKTSEKVDKLTEAAGQGIKKATTETKQYIQDAKDTAQEQGEEGFIGLAKTLGTKVGTDVSSLVRNGYEKIASSESIQNLKKELSEAEEKHNSENQESPSVDLSKVTLEHVFSMFFSGVNNGNEWTTSSQPNNPKNERLIKVTYIVNGQEWFNKETQESGIGAFDLTLDFLSNQTGLSLLDKESAVELFNKTQSMITKLIEQIDAEKAQEEADKVKKATTKKVANKPETTTAKETTAVKKATAKKVANKPETTTAKETTAVKKATAKKVVNNPETTTAKETTAVKKATAKKVVNKPETTTAKETTAVKKATAKKVVNKPETTTAKETTSVKKPTKKVVNKTEEKKDE